jgi:hypothetical protein
MSSGTDFLKNCFLLTFTRMLRDSLNIFENFPSVRNSELVTNSELVEILGSRTCGCDFAVVVEYHKVVRDFKRVDLDPQGPKPLLHKLALEPFVAVCRLLLQNGSKNCSTPRHEVSIEFRFAAHYRKTVRKISQRKVA